MGGIIPATDGDESGVLHCDCGYVGDRGSVWDVNVKLGELLPGYRLSMWTRMNAGLLRVFKPVVHPPAAWEAMKNHGYPSQLLTLDANEQYMFVGEKENLAIWFAQNLEVHLNNSGPTHDRTVWYAAVNMAYVHFFRRNGGSIGGWMFLNDVLSHMKSTKATQVVHDPLRRGKIIKLGKRLQTTED